MSAQCKTCDGTGKAPNMADIKRLRAIRAASGLSRREMARRLKLSHVYLGAIEKANGGVGTISWHVYAEVLKKYHAEYSAIVDAS